MSNAEVNLTLTQAARKIAEQKGLRFARSVRYSENLDHDIKVPRNSRQMYLAAGLSTTKALAALERGVRQAARIDFDDLTEDDRRRIIDNLEGHVSQLSYQVVKAAKKQDWGAAHARCAELEGALQRLQGFVNEN